MAKASPIREPSSQVVGTSYVARAFGMSTSWAYELLRRWHREQLAGGEPKVFVVVGAKGNRSLKTTLGVLHRHAPTARDEHLHREVRRLNKDLDVACGRIDRLMHERDALERRVRKLEDAIFSLENRRRA